MCPTLARWKLDSMNWGEEKEESVPMLSAEMEDSLSDTDSDKSGPDEFVSVKDTTESVDQLNRQPTPDGSVPNLSYS